MLKVLHPLLPLLVAGAITFWGSDVVSNLDMLWAVSIGGTTLLLFGQRDLGSRLTSEAKEIEDRFVRRLNEAASQIRGVLDNADVLRRSLDRFNVQQQTAGARLSDAADRVEKSASALDARDGRDVLAARVQAARASEDLDAVRNLLINMYRSLWRIERDPLASSPALVQLRKQFKAGLRRDLKWEILDETGVKIDPDLHEVVGVVPTPDCTEKGLVASVENPGFKAGDSVLARAHVLERTHVEKRDFLAELEHLDGSGDSEGGQGALPELSQVPTAAATDAVEASTTPEEL